MSCNYFVNLVIINKCDKYLRVARFKIEAKIILFIFVNSVFKLLIRNILQKSLNNIITFISQHAQVFLNYFHRKIVEFTKCLFRDAIIINLRTLLRYNLQ